MGRRRRFLGAAGHRPFASSAVVGSDDHDDYHAAAVAAQRRARRPDLGDPDGPGGAGTAGGHLDRAIGLGPTPVRAVGLDAEGQLETLVLITCGGDFNPEIRRYRHNIVVYATPVT